jgi:O-antigen/teichoic acid export membrane protein
LDKPSTPPTTRFVSSTIALGIASVVSLVFGMAGTMIVARRFDTAVFGAYTLILVVVSFLAQVSSFGLESAISKFTAGARDEAQKEALFATAVCMRLGAIGLTTLLAWFGRPYIAQLFGDSLLPNLLIYVPVLFFLESFRTLLKAMLEGSFRFSRIGIADVIASTLNFGLLLVVVVLVKGDIHFLLITKGIASLASCAFAYFSIPVRKKFAIDFKLFKEVFFFGFPLQINAILTFIFTRIDTLMIGSMLGAANIAFYENARNIPDSLRNLYEPFRAVYFPSLSKRYAAGDREGAGKLLQDASRFVSFITILGAAIALLFGEDMIRLIFSEKYLPSAPVFSLLMVSLSIALTSNVLGITLVAVGQPDKPMWINVVHTAASIAANALLIPPLGIQGAAIASIIGTAAAYPPNLYFLHKQLPAGVMPFLKPLLVFAVWAGLALALHPTGWVLRIGFLLVFAAACYLCGVFTREDLALLLQAAGISTEAPLRRLWPGAPKP